MEALPATDVQITADALVQLRANPGLQRGFEFEDPCARHFVTPAGRAMADMAQALDPVYAPFNLARYRYLGERQREAVANYPQLLRLGVGFDARPYWDATLLDARCAIFEVDFEEKLSHRDRVLSQAGFERPAHVHPVPLDLASADLVERLAAAGYRRDMPTFVVMEGVSFFLSGVTLRALVQALARSSAVGSQLLLDAWSAVRIEGMQQRILERTGRRLFGEPGLGGDADAIARCLRASGYAAVEIQLLASIAASYHLDYVRDPVPESWLIVQATVAG